MARIAIDFDDSLVGIGDDGEVYPIPGAREQLQALRSDGHAIVIYTCRITIARRDGRLAEELAELEDMLAAFDLQYDEIYIGDKLIADAYVDDRAIPFRGDWPATGRDLTAFLRKRRF